MTNWNYDPEAPHPLARHKGKECEKCKGEIGWNNFVICYDGINQKPVTFHTACRPVMSDVQQNHQAHLLPGHFGMQPRSFG